MTEPRRPPRPPRHWVKRPPRPSRNAQPPPPPAPRPYRPLIAAIGALLTGFALAYLAANTHADPAMTWAALGGGAALGGILGWRLGG